MNRKLILASGLALFAAASSGGFAVQTFGGLLFFRLLQGMGTAMIYSTSMAILVSLGAECTQYRARLLSYSAAATYLGLSAGPAVGGVLSHKLGWRWIFAAAAFVSAVAFFCALRAIRRDRLSGNGESFGFESGGRWFSSGKIFSSRADCILYICSAAAFIAGLSAVSEGIWGWIAAGCGISGLIFYIYREWKSRNPMLPVKMFIKRPVFGLAVFASMINYGTNFVLNYLLSIYMQTALGFSSQKAGLILVISPAVQAFISPCIGRISGKKVSPQWLSAGGMAGTAASAVFLGMMQTNAPIGWIYAGLILAGVSCAFFASPNSSVVMNAAGEKYYSMAAAVLSTLRSLGHSISIASAAGVTAAFSDAGRLTEADPDSMLTVMKVTFFMWGGLCILGFFMALPKKV